MTKVPKSSQGYIPVVFLAGLGVLGYGMFQIVSKLTEGDFEAKGELVAKGTPHGDITLSGGTCLVGERFDYEGVLVKNKTGSGAVRVIQDASGPTVRIEVPGTCRENHAGCQYVDVPRASCSKFDVYLEKTANLYNKRRVWIGRVNLACKLERGTVDASLVFQKCA